MSRLCDGGRGWVTSTDQSLIEREAPMKTGQLLTILPFSSSGEGQEWGRGNAEWLWETQI